MVECDNKQKAWERLCHMIRKSGILLTIIVLAFTLCTGMTGTVMAEAAAVPETDYGLVQSEGISIPVFTEENMRVFDIPDNDALRFSKELKVGWNLGNTFDAFGKSGVEAETSWGNPKTTKEMIDAVCEKGFNAIRIPVTYADHMGPAPDYTVEPEWFDRVEEVINYALDDGMYVIINTHHEEAWRIPDDAHIDAVDAQNKA